MGYCQIALCQSVVCLGLYTGYCNHNVNTGNRFRFPFFNRESNRPSTANDRWSDNSNTNIPDTDQGVIYEQEDSKAACTVVKTYDGYVPTAKTKVSFINAFEAEKVTVDQCVQACCEKGSLVCQYAWIIDKKCILIGCTQDESELCSPIEFSHSSLQSVYIQVSSKGPFPKGLFPNKPQYISAMLPYETHIRYITSHKRKLPSSDL